MNNTKSDIASFPQNFSQILKIKDYQKKLSIALIVTVTFQSVLFFYSNSQKP